MPLNGVRHFSCVGPELHAPKGPNVNSHERKLVDRVVGTPFAPNGADETVACLPPPHSRCIRAFERSFGAT